MSHASTSQPAHALPIRGVLSACVTGTSASGARYGEGTLRFMTSTGRRRIIRAVADGRALDAVRTGWGNGHVGLMCVLHRDVATVVGGIDHRSSTEWLSDAEFAGVEIVNPMGWTYRNGNPLPRGKRLDAAMAEPVSYEEFRLRLANSVTSVRHPL